MRARHWLVSAAVAAGSLAALGLRASREASELAVPVRWVRGADADTPEGRARFRAGLTWSLSSLGALPPPDVTSFLRDERVTPEGLRFTLDLGAAGFPAASLPAVARAVAPLLRSDEVALFGAVDAGRLLMATLHSPFRYYEITGACATLEGWKALRIGPTPLRYGVVVSQLAEGKERLVSFEPLPGTGATLRHVAFLAHEGPGSLLSGTFRAVESEVVDVMPNGQQRFAVYGSDGRLQAGASPAVSPAGQPGRCMWCHERSLQLGTPASPTVPGHLSAAEFQERVRLAQAVIDASRRTLVTSIDFEEYHVHNWAEWIVEEFLAPSPERVAREWGVDVATVLDAAKGLPTHLHEEYASWGLLYARADVDALLAGRLAAAGTRYTPSPVLPSAREIDPDAPGVDEPETVARMRTCREEPVKPPVRPDPSSRR